MTLGIPRLQEILQRASDKILTPVMTCPLRKGRTRQVFLFFFLIFCYTWLECPHNIIKEKKIPWTLVAYQCRGLLQIIFAPKLMDDGNNDTIYCTKLEVPAVLALQFKVLSWSYFFSIFSTEAFF